MTATIATPPTVTKAEVTPAGRLVVRLSNGARLYSAVGGKYGWLVLVAWTPSPDDEHGRKPRLRIERRTGDFQVAHKIAAASRSRMDRQTWPSGRYDTILLHKRAGDVYTVEAF